MDRLEINDSNIIYVSQFGSYGSEEWVENISDIDIGVIAKSIEDLDHLLEDKLTNYFKAYYNYPIINITITEYDIDTKLCRNIICGKTLYSSIDEKYIKKQCLYIEKTVNEQRTYYEFRKLEKLKEEVNDLW